MLSSPWCDQVLAAILESAEEAIVVIDLEGSIKLWSRGAERLYGYAAAEVTGQSACSLLPIYEVPAFQASLSAARDGSLAPAEVVERMHKLGSKLSVAVRRSMLRDNRGAIIGIIETGRSSGESSANTSADLRLLSLVEQIPALVWTTDSELRLTSSWGSFLRQSENYQQDLIGRPVAEYLNCQDTNSIPTAHHHAVLRGESVQFEYLRKNRVLEIRLEPLRSSSGEIVGCIGIGLDITKRKRSEEQIRYQATHDALTGLGNYREFVEALERELRRAERSHHSFSLLLLDLDDLKRINDHQGHLAGNRALQRLARVMKEHCRATDLAARYGGDEFAVVLIDSDSRMAEQIAARIDERVRNDGEEPRISVSIGMAVYPADGRTSQDLIEAADQKLYKQKRRVTSKNVSVG
ncbi:MAG TPA: diguanylate cyclase [Candidatus Acidoferrum sp.]|nr:diguanylate cyclase [Candidatus Acidoferrum sp.]